MQTRSPTRAGLAAGLSLSMLLAGSDALAQASLSGPPPGKPGPTSASVSPGAASSVSVSPGTPPPAAASSAFPRRRASRIPPASQRTGEGTTNSTSMPKGGAVGGTPETSAKTPQGGPGK